MSAAVILCAGKGTRMQDDSINKVCFPCAGVPVIRRIIQNLRAGGVSTFAVVVGHKAQTVMDVLAEEEGVLYAYQKDQKGTGHAALCGLLALKNAGFSGRVIVTMGDKIIAPDVVRGLLSCDENCKAVWGVQPLSANYNGGRVVFHDNKVYGVVEFADAALLAIADAPESSRAQILKDLRLNEKKAVKVLQKAEEGTAASTKTLCGRVFTADEILSTPYANAGLYCFDATAAVEAIQKCDSANAQGEIYLTDTLEMFAQRNEAIVYVVKNKTDMLTYSTKPELFDISNHFHRSASEFVAALRNGSMDSAFKAVYENIDEQKARYTDLISIFKDKYGDKKIIATRAPGRVNLMGRHIDHRGGSLNVMTIDRDVVMIAAPRNDDTVNVTFTGGTRAEDSFEISVCLSLGTNASWLDYLESAGVKKALAESSGSATNYIKSSIFRMQFENNVPLCGMDIVLDGSIPMAAGLSSSSAIVVATMEAVCHLNNLHPTDKEFVELCGEAEWFVGSRGGAGDHATMKCGKRGQITHLSFKPFTIGRNVSFSDKYALLIANSMQMAKKSEGSKDKFNAKVAACEVALMLLNKQFPEYGFVEFRDIAKVTDITAVYKMVLSLPCTMTRAQIIDELPEYIDKLNRIFASHIEPTAYDIRGVALYGISECVRAEKCLDALSSGDYHLLGEMMNISHRGDSVTDTMDVSDAVILQLAQEKTPLHLVAGAYACSTERIDGLCMLLNSCDGVLGSALVGAGLGGCVIALVEKDNAELALETIGKEYYDKLSLERSAAVYLPSSGSAVLF